jgi:hypothetical protein
MKKLFSILTLIFTLVASGQLQQEEEKRAYLSPDGDLYWNKSLPVYIELNISYGSDSTIPLKKPFYLDTEGDNYLRTKWEYDSTGNYTTPKREQIWKIIADSKPPKTSVEFISSESYDFKGQTYYSDDLKVRLTAKDRLSGVQKIYYSINGSDFMVYDSLVSFEPKLDIDFKFYSVDNVGNVEKVSDLEYEYDNNKVSFSIDNTPPTSQLTTTDSVFSPRDKIGIISEDDHVGVSDIFFKIDSNHFVKYTTPIILDSIKQGHHKITYLSQDWLGNREEEKTFDFFLDATPPEVRVDEEMLEDGLTHLRKISIFVHDNYCGVRGIFVKLADSEEFKEYRKPFFIDVSHSEIMVKVVDNVGNEAIRIITYAIDE